MHEYTVSDIMTLNVATATPDTSLREVVKKLHSGRFSCLVIVNDKEPIGIITERDMVAILADLLEEESSWMDMPVKNFMTTPVTSVGDDLTLFEAVDIARVKTIRHMPVVNEEGHLVGVLTQANIVNGYYNSALDV